MVKAGSDCRKAATRIPVARVLALVAIGGVSAYSLYFSINTEIKIVDLRGNSKIRVSNYRVGNRTSINDEEWPNQTVLLLNETEGGDMYSYMGRGSNATESMFTMDAKSENPANEDLVGIKGSDAVSNHQHNDKNKVIIDPSKNKPRMRLRFRWTKLKLLSPLARKMVAHQKNCSIPLANLVHRNCCGLGSDLHVYTQAILNGMDSSNRNGDIFRTRTAFPWNWYDEESCHETVKNSSLGHASPMLCYFPKAELQCPGDYEIATKNVRTFNAALDNITDVDGLLYPSSPAIMNEYGPLSDVRAATMEYLFHRTSPLVVHEAARQLRMVFGGGMQNHTTHNGTKWSMSPTSHEVPEDLVTVHIRWGDKGIEMNLVPIEKYIDAVKSIEERRKREGGNKNINIFLATEDPRAADEFLTNAPSHWTVFLDQYYYEYLPHRIGDEMDANPTAARKLKGRTGLIAMGSLLVAMEANDFVLTTGSNWSRILDELRRAIVEPRCDRPGCTSMIDLMPEAYPW